MNPEKRTRPAGQSDLEVWEDLVIDEKDSRSRGLEVGRMKAVWHQKWAGKEKKHSCAR